MHIDVVPERGINLLVKLLPVLPAKAAALLLQVKPPLLNMVYEYV